MKNACSSVALPAICIAMLLPALATAQSVTRVVDSDGRASGVSCDATSPVPATIQAAIELSASDDTILVCPGVYQEQLKIVAKNLTIRGVTSGVKNQVLIKPIGVVANSTNAYSGGPIAAAIAIEDSTSVILGNLTVDGLDNGLSDCGTTLVGIFYRNSSGEVQSTAVRNIRLGSSLGSCQSGYGIFAQSGSGGSSNLTVNGGSIHGYQKAGILANEIGTQVVVTASTIAGDGPSPMIAQNGIQIGFGATGTIAGNSIVNHLFACPTSPCDIATNVLVFDANDVTIRGNTTAHAGVNIYLVGSNDSEVRNNRVSDTSGFDGIAVVGSRNRVQLNHVDNSTEFALSIEGDRNIVGNNVINEAACGIFWSGTGNWLYSNTISSTEITTCQPFTLFQAKSLKTMQRSAGAAVNNAAGLPMRAAAPAR